MDDERLEEIRKELERVGLELHRTMDANNQWVAAIRRPGITEAPVIAQSGSTEDEAIEASYKEFKRRQDEGELLGLWPSTDEPS